MKDYGEFEILGRTRDDAAGEAFDKVARAVGLGYPGGPKIDKAAKEGNPHAIEFPRAKVGDNPYDFSFSGLKSAVLNYINHAKMMGEEIHVPDLAASFQNAVVEVLVSRTIEAAKQHGYKRVAIAGVVAMHPKCIVLDEPTAMLDPNGRKEVIRAVRALNQVEKVTAILITHYMEEVIYADKVIVMDDGKIVMQGTPFEIFAQVDTLKKYRLDVPQVTLLAHELRKAGVDLPECVLSTEELVKALCQ